MKIHVDALVDVRQNPTLIALNTEKLLGVQRDQGRVLADIDQGIHVYFHRQVRRGEIDLAHLRQGRRRRPLQWDIFQYGRGCAGGGADDEAGEEGKHGNAVGHLSTPFLVDPF